jgi:hypothetical protein
VRVYDGADTVTKIVWTDAALVRMQEQALLTRVTPYVDTKEEPRDFKVATARAAIAGAVKVATFVDVAVATAVKYVSVPVGREMTLLDTTVVKIVLVLNTVSVANMSVTSLVCTITVL